MTRLIRNSIVLFLILPICAGKSAFAQDEDHHSTSEHSYGFHKLTVIAGNVLLDNSFTEQTDDILIVPAYGLSYDYIFNNGLGLGLHSDILLQQFKAEAHVHNTAIAPTPTKNGLHATESEGGIEG